MRLIGLMLVRNEAWCIGAALRTALRWCDGVFVLMDRCTDLTRKSVYDVAINSRVDFDVTKPENLWMEMDHRQLTLERGRKMGGTHFAVIDGDEILTANLFVPVRRAFEALAPSEVLELPRISPTTLDTYWADQHDHACGGITLGFMDSPELAWRPRGEEKYHFHGRPPHGSGEVKTPLGRDREQGGVMHMQYANRNRMRAKSLWYMLNERIRWPDRKTPEELNAIYGAMLDTPQTTLPIPPDWWTEDKAFVHPDEAESWHLQECRDMVKAYGREILTGLDTRGFTI